MLYLSILKTIKNYEETVIMNYNEIRTLLEHLNCTYEKYAINN